MTYAPVRFLAASMTGVAAGNNADKFMAVSGVSIYITVPASGGSPKDGGRRRGSHA